MKVFALSILFLLVCAVSAELILTTCARMDVPILSKVARGLCINSCKYQNCGTGDCVKSGGRPVCKCFRCANGGGAWPSIPLPKGRGGKGRGRRA